MTVRDILNIVAENATTPLTQEDYGILYGVLEKQGVGTEDQIIPQGETAKLFLDGVKLMRLNGAIMEAELGLKDANENYKENVALFRSVSHDFVTSPSNNNFARLVEEASALRARKLEWQRQQEVLSRLKSIRADPPEPEQERPTEASQVTGH